MKKRKWECMRETIIRKLHEIEKTENVRILLAVESGSLPVSLHQYGRRQLPGIPERCQCQGKEIFLCHASCSGLPLDIRERNTAANAFYRTYGSRVAGKSAAGVGASS